MTNRSGFYILKEGFPIKEVFFRNRLQTHRMCAGK